MLNAFAHQPAAEDDEEMPLEEQLRIISIENPTLTTDEIAVLTSARQLVGGSRAKRTTVPG
jgi:hypothetical protein